VGAPVPLARQRDVARALRAFLPERAVLHEEEDTRPYECDGLTAYRQLPMVVALPETEEQVRRVLQACACPEGRCRRAMAFCFPWPSSCV
jgi:glycolate oxidase